jgi:hypothetical protein
MPKDILKTFWEKTLQPPIFLLVMLFLGGKLVNNDRRANVLANGQYLLFRRDAYEKIGGHESVKSQVVEDVCLGRLVKTAGLRLRVFAAGDALQVRMYDSLAGIWKGWRKGFYEVAEGRKLLNAIFHVVLLFIQVVPFFIFTYGILVALGHPFNIYFLIEGFMCALLLGTIFSFDRFLGVNLIYGLFFPMAIMMYLGIGLDSTMRGIFGLGVVWKDRVYIIEGGRST